MQKKHLKKAQPQLIIKPLRKTEMERKFLKEVSQLDKELVQQFHDWHYL